MEWSTKDSAYSFRIRGRDAQPDFTYAPIQITFMVHDEGAKELKLLLKFME